VRHGEPLSCQRGKAPKALREQSFEWGGVVKGFLCNKITLRGEERVKGGRSGLGEDRGGGQSLEGRGGQQMIMS